jgi:WS/DGAT/MGAT family acyltransferase
MKQVAGRDAAYLYLGDGNASATVVSCHIVANPADRPLAITQDQLLEWIRERIWITDLLTSKLIRLPVDIGFPYWLPDPEFSPAAHLRVHRTDGTWAAARDLLAVLGDTPMDLDHAPWLMHVIPDLTGVPDRTGLSSLVVFQFHHVAFDGVTSATLGEKVFSDGTVDEHTRPAGRVVGPGTASRAALTRRELQRTPGLWWRFARVGVGLIRTSRDKSRRRARTGDTTGRRTWPTTRFNGIFRGPRVAGHLLFDRNDVLEMKSRVPGATVNDLILSIVGEAVAEYLERKNEAPGSSLSALVPVSTRGMRETDSANQFIPMVVDLQTCEPNLRDRILAIASETTRKKARMKAHLATTPVELIDVAPAPVLRLIGYLSRRGRKRVVGHPRFNVVITNLPGEQPHGSILGIDVVDSFVMQPLGSGATLAHAVSDRGDAIAMSITVDQTVMPDVNEYCEIIRDSFKAHQIAIN